MLFQNVNGHMWFYMQHGSCCWTPSLFLFDLVYYYHISLYANVLVAVILKSDALISNYCGCNFCTTSLQSVDLSLFICLPLSSDILFVFNFDRWCSSTQSVYSAWSRCILSPTEVLKFCTHSYRSRPKFHR